MVACNGDGVGPNGDDTGSFTASVSGDVTATLEGQAIFGEFTQEGETGWAVWLVSDAAAADDYVAWFIRAGTRPEGGTYTLADVQNTSLQAGDIGAFMTGTNDQVTVSMSSTGGTFTVSSSSSDRVQGTFTVQATGFIVTGSRSVEGTVTITGEFDATQGTVNLPGL